jgi:hypothetical protein
MITTIPLAELVEDFDIYPRHEVSSINVRNLIAAHAAGHKIQPIIADKKTKRIIDGFHRRRMWLKVLSADAAIEVDLKDYKTDADMLAAAVEANSEHGLQLQEIDKRRIVLRLQELGTDDNHIAKVLHIPVTRLQKLRIRVADVTQQNGSIRKEPLKRPHFHMQDKKMTEEQAKAARSAPGTSYALVIRQVHDAIRFDLLNKDDPRLVTALKALNADLAEYLSGLAETA